MFSILYYIPYIIICVISSYAHMILAVGNIDTSGISMLEEVNKILRRRDLKVIPL